MEKISVADPWVGIDPVGEPHEGDVFTISGTTDIPAGKNISLGIVIIGHGGPKQMSEEEREWTDRNALVQTGYPLNTWMVTINSSHLRAYDDYTLCVDGDDNIPPYSNTRNCTLFQLYPARTNLS
jgi:hypothetical protein